MVQRRKVRIKRKNGIKIEAAPIIDVPTRSPQQHELLDCLDDIVEAVDKELLRQYKKWGDQAHSTVEWNSIVMEEYGEMTQAINDSYWPSDQLDKRLQATENAMTECVETITCLVSLYHQIKKGRDALVSIRDSKAS